MLEEVPGKINDEQRRNLNDVLTSRPRLQDLLKDIVASSKIHRILRGFDAKEILVVG